MQRVIILILIVLVQSCNAFAQKVRVPGTMSNSKGSAEVGQMKEHATLAVRNISLTALPRNTAIHAVASYKVCI